VTQDSAGIAAADAEQNRIVVEKERVSADVSRLTE